MVMSEIPFREPGCAARFALAGGLKLGQSGSSARPYDIMAGWLLKKGVDGPKRLARTLAPPKSANKNRKTCFLQSKRQFCPTFDFENKL
jgi:hypothetical protein